MLPESGIRAMLAVSTFDIDFNAFAGSLPLSFFELMSLKAVDLASNSLAGTLPQRLCSWTTLRIFTVWKNHFEGSIPSFRSEAMFVHHNRFEGSLAQQHFESRDHRSKVVVASEVLHEGTIPATLSRMTITKIHVALGHGLSGPLPSIPGTVSLLSVWQNGLNGNLLSCKLPQNGGVYAWHLSEIALANRSSSHSGFSQ
eukprot:5170151-Amphidinium_carterae.1